MTERIGGPLTGGAALHLFPHRSPLCGPVCRFAQRGGIRAPPNSHGALCGFVARVREQAVVLQPLS